MCQPIYTRKFFLITIAVSLALTTFSHRVAAQNTTSKFTVDDFLNVANMNITDLSDNGQWLVATSGSLMDRIGNDNSRLGDPTYMSPAVSDLWVIETQTGKKQKLFSNKRQVTNMKWSPAGDRLALFVRKGDLKEPMIWERATGKFITITLPAGKQAANNSAYYWSADGSQLIFAIWKDSVRQKAATEFNHETNGSIVVRSGKDPFLSWDALRRMPLVRSFLSYDLKTGKIREILPEAKLSAFRLVGDGSSVVYFEDITKKTDYDVIGGADNQVYLSNTATGEKRIIIKSTKGLNIFWSEDNSRYAYSKDGSIFIASVYDKEMRQLTGEKTDSVKGDTTSGKPKEDPRCP